jgi:biotin transporter BioY
VVDADGDGKKDLVGTWADGTMTAYLNLGTPGHPLFGNQQDLGGGWQGITRIAVADADADGKQDLVGTWADGTMTAYLNLGTPGHPLFGNQQDLGGGWQGITRIVVADADDDGTQDLVGTWADGTMTAYLNLGTPGHPLFGNQQNIGVGWSGITRIVTVH